jgi:predicted AAA+ superfamily ATPase
MELNAILLEQQAEAALVQENSIHRDKSLVFSKMLKSKLIKIVMGIRRSGKSTLCLQAIPEKEQAYINFDDERLVSVQASDLNQVYESLCQIKPQARFFIFDEIQNIPHWELFVNRLHRKGLNVIVTGSNGKLLAKELASNLTGRHLTLELFTFSFREYLKFQNIEYSDLQITEVRSAIKRELQTYFEVGGFPEVLKGEILGPYLRELFDKIITRDLAERYRLRNIRIIKELAIYLIQNSGGLTSLEILKKTFDFKSINSLRNYLGYLQDVYLIYELSAYSYKIKERSTLPKKYFAGDLGMMRALNSKPTPDLGAKLETLVFIELKRREQEIFYLKGDGYDVDFCISKNSKIKSLIQVCYSMTSEQVKKREIGSLVNAYKAFSKLASIDSLIVITWDERLEIKIDGITIKVIPIWQWLLEVTN